MSVDESLDESLSGVFVHSFFFFFKQDFYNIMTKKTFP